MVRLAALLLITSALGGACEFKFDAVAIPRYYRADGWQLPGIIDYNAKAKVDYLGLYQASSVAGAKAFALPHDEDPYIVELPVQLFTLDGKEQRMRSMQARAGILRWEMGGKIFAYSYGLVPVAAHRTNGVWKIDVEVGCVFSATFIDETGDGVFRLLVPSKLTESLVPAWVKKPEAD